jgi:hypothetical protein
MQDERQRKQEVSDQIVKGVDKVDNLPPDLYKRLTPTEIKQFPANANSYRRAEQVQTNDQQYRDLLGLYNNDNAKFMDTNIYQVPGISKENMNFFLHLQRSAQSNGDPRVSRAMNWLKGYNPTMLDDLGVTGPAKDRDASNQFVGALHEAIQSYQETNGVAPSEKIITKEILPVITRDVVSKGWLWDSKTPFFKSDVPDEYKDQYLKLSPLANDTEIRHAYNRQMFDKFFKEKPSSGKTQGKFGE